MALSVKEYQEKLINKIALAASQQEVGELCDSVMKKLETLKVNIYIAAQFVNKLLRELESFKPDEKKVQQWINIHRARIYFDVVRLQLNTAGANQNGRERDKQDEHQRTSSKVPSEKSKNKL